MENNNIEFYIVPDYYGMNIKIWAKESFGDIINNYSTGDKGLTCVTIKSGEVPPESVQPLLSLPIGMANALFDKIFEYKLESGAKIPDKDIMEGKLIATEKHLEDMREISKKLLNSKLGIK